MTAGETNHNVDLGPPPVVATIEQRSMIIGVVASLAAVIGFWFVPAEQFMHSYLLGFLSWFGLTLGSLAVLMLQYMTGGKWGFIIRRILEAAIKTFPLIALLFIPLAAGTHQLYDWAKPDKLAHNQHLRELTQDFLNPIGYSLRSAVYLVILGGLIYLLTRWSAQQDQPPVRDFNPLYKKLCAPGLVIYAFTVSLATIDWVMSIDARWISTIYPLIFIAGEVLLALAFMVVVETILFRSPPMAYLLKGEELRDHGNLILTFVMLWAYFSFSQLLILWSGNLPNEISWYYRRWTGGWQYLGLALAAFHFGLPFALLLSRERKRHVHRLVKVAILVIFMRFVDLFWFVAPNLDGQVVVHWLDVVIPLAMGGLWLGYFFHNLKGRPLLPLYDPETERILELAHD